MPYPSEGLRPEIENDPPDDSFGLLGVRTNFWPLPLLVCNVRIILLIYFDSYSVNLQRAEVWGARDTSVPLIDRKSTRLNSSHPLKSRMPSSA